VAGSFTSNKPPRRKRETTDVFEPKQKPRRLAGLLLGYGFSALVHLQVPKVPRMGHKGNLQVDKCSEELIECSIQKRHPKGVEFGAP
jgi:hypothetical protein